MNVKAADRVRALVTVIACAILLYALFVSATHIAHVGHTVGLRAFEGNTLFILIDIPIVVGKLMVLRYFAPTTRRTGRRLMVAGLLASLACNVASGLISGGYGAAAYGVLVVTMAFAMENAIGKIKPAGAVTKAKAPAATTTPAPRRKATKATRTPKAPAAAPVSPATVREIEEALSR
jgi:hypothetical protein